MRIVTAIIAVVLIVIGASGCGERDSNDEPRVVPWESALYSREERMLLVYVPGGKKCRGSKSESDKSADEISITVRCAKFKPCDDKCSPPPPIRIKANGPPKRVRDSADGKLRLVCVLPELLINDRCGPAPTDMF